MKLRMDLKSFSLGVLIGALALACVAAVTPAAENPFERKTPMEFHIVGSNLRQGAEDLQTRMNRASASGWEFVEAHPLGTGTVFAIFQKPKG